MNRAAQHKAISKPPPAASPRNPFIVGMDASVVRDLGKHARALYTALRYMADGQTGELRIRRVWYKAKQFDREAKMCERVRLAAMRELVSAGLVTFTRPRVRRMVSGRLRAVAGGVHYVVHKQPVPLKGRTRIPSKLHLQNCIPGSLLEMQPQVFPNPPVGARGEFCSEFENSLAEGRARSSSAPKGQTSEDDDSRISSISEKNPNAKTNPSVEEGPTPVDKLTFTHAALSSQVTAPLAYLKSISPDNQL